MLEYQWWEVERASRHPSVSSSDDLEGRQASTTKSSRAGPDAEVTTKPLGATSVPRGGFSAALVSTLPPAGMTTFSELDGLGSQPHPGASGGDSLKGSLGALRCSSGSVGSRSVAAVDDEEDMDFVLHGDDMFGDRDEVPVEEQGVGSDQKASRRWESLGAHSPKADAVQPHVPREQDARVGALRTRGPSVSVRSVPLRAEPSAMSERVRHLEAVNAALVSRLEVFRAQNLANVQAALQERDALLVSACLVLVTWSPCLMAHSRHFATTP